MSSIVAGGPADAAGFEREDVVLDVDGEAVAGSRDLTRRVGAFSAGEEVRFRILRDGREYTLRARLGDRPTDDELDEMANRGEAEAEVSYFGLTLVPLTDEDREVRGIEDGMPGLVVDGIDANEEAARKGITGGDIILEAGGNPVGSAETFRAAVDEAREDGRSAILLLVEGRGGQRYVALQLGEED